MEDREYEIIMFILSENFKRNPIIFGRESTLRASLEKPNETANWNEREEFFRKPSGLVEGGQIKIVTIFFCPLTMHVLQTHVASFSNSIADNDKTCRQRGSNPRSSIWRGGE